jgi:type VI secretion system secreted protein Hcp
MAIDAYGWFVGGKSAIEGETNDEEIKKKKGFDIEDFSFGVQNQVNVGSASGGLGSGRVELDKLEFTKNTDTATCPLVLAACTGGHFDEFHLSLRKGGASKDGSGGEFIHITMYSVVVESVKWSGSDGDETFKDAITIAFAGIKIEYSIQDFKGDLKKAPGLQGQVEWNQTTNKSKAV